MTTKDKIYNVGTRLFRAKGFTATSMQELADQVGIKAASIYNHFDSKHAILEDLLLKGAQMFVQGMSGISASTLPATEKIEKLIGLHVQLTIAHTDLMSLMATEWRHLEGGALNHYVSERDSYEKEFRSILKQAIDDGELIHIDVDIAVFSILTTLKWFYSWYDKHSDLNPFDLEKYLIQCLLDGLRRK